MSEYNKEPQKYSPEWFQWLGSRGGRRSSLNMTPEERRERARKAGKASALAKKRLGEK